MFGLNPVTLAKQEVLKIDENHNGVPDAIEALDALESTTDKIGSFFGNFDAKDIELILELMPAAVKAKLPGNLITDIAEEFAALPAQMKAAKIALEKVEASLKAK
jgi:hypothetical protein